jgi:hypothetical protein
MPPGLFGIRWHKIFVGGVEHLLPNGVMTVIW